MRTCLRPDSEESSWIDWRCPTYIARCCHSGYRALGHPERWPSDCRPPEVVTLEIADAFGAQQRCVLCVLDAFGHRGQTEALDETEKVAEKKPGLWPPRQIS